ncbi:MAG: hypothetical protein K2V38_16455, partial [Gemmataceae bacterium]|nr:hypothetical protein [Gemmataceae bacterium]
MNTLLCPKCRQPMPDDALDAGQCPVCGFGLDGPLVLADAARKWPRVWVLAAGVVVLTAAAGLGFAL